MFGIKPLILSEDYTKELKDKKSKLIQEKEDQKKKDKQLIQERIDKKKEEKKK